MIKLVVMLARATNSSIDSFLKLPVHRLCVWADATADILKEENRRNVN